MKLTKKEWACTFLLSGIGIGTSILIHHHGRRLTNPNARLSDYPKAVANAFSLALNSSKLFDPYLKTYAAKPHFISGIASLYQTAQGAWTDGFGVVGLDKDQAILWQTNLPTRLHDMIIGNHIIAMGRRPSEQFWVLDKAGVIIKEVISAPNRHFYGHGCLSVDGKWLYVCENNTDTLTGCIGIYDTTTYHKVGEFDGCGIGPHEIVCHPDGVHLIIAGGGIQTEKASRLELNLDTMTPALYYMNRHTGQVVAHLCPTDPLMSIRHLAVCSDGLVVIGIQYQGDKDKRVPLILTHTLGDDSLTPILLDDIYRLGQYVASVAVNSPYNLACIASPIGGHSIVIDLKLRQETYSLALADCAGVCAIHLHSAKRFLVSDGTGRLTTLSVDSDGDWSSQSVSHTMAFDNHLRVINSQNISNCN